MSGREPHQNMSEIRTLYDLEPGRTVSGRYLIEASHRQGELSTTFAVQDEDGHKRELHVFPSAMFEGEGQMGEFATSLQRWSRIDSAAVIKVYDAMVLGQLGCVLVTDFPSGALLRGRLDAAWDSEDVVRVGCQLLEGLVAIHGHGLVHGDVKPATVYVDGQGAGVNATLVDGGVTPGLWSAKHLGDKTALIGTPFYAPIEQFGGESPDVQSDIYNVATVLFELLAGVLPWPGKSFLEVFQAKLDKGAPSIGRRAPTVEVEPGLETVIVKGLLADKQQRYASGAEFLTALSEFR